QKHGKASFERIIAASKRLSQVIWETQMQEYNLDLPEGRAALEDACKKLAEKIADPTVRQHYTSYFRKQLWAKTSQSAKPAEKRSPQIGQMVVAHHSAALHTLANRLLKTLLQFPA